MIIELTPVVVFGEADFLAASVAGDSLKVNGVLFDFSPLDDGDSLPRAAFPDKWVLGARRDAGQIHVSLLFPIPPEASYEARFPVPINAGDGVVLLPWVAPPAEQLGPGVVWEPPVAGEESASDEEEAKL